MFVKNISIKFLIIGIYIISQPIISYTQDSLHHIKAIQECDRISDARISEIHEQESLAREKMHDAFTYGAHCLDAINSQSKNHDHQYLNYLLMHAISNKYLSHVAKKVLEIGAHPNCKDFDGKPALMMAISSNNIENAQLLLQHKADPNIRYRPHSYQMSPGRNQTHIPCNNDLVPLNYFDGSDYNKSYHEELVTLLLDHGADSTLMRADGYNITGLDDLSKIYASFRTERSARNIIKEFRESDFGKQLFKAIASYAGGKKPFELANMLNARIPNHPDLTVKDLLTLDTLTEINKLDKNAIKYQEQIENIESSFMRKQPKEKPRCSC